MSTPQDRTGDYQLPSRLFTVRVWQERIGVGTSEVRFQVKHVLSGESRLFRDGESFLHYLVMKVNEVEEDHRPPA